MAVAITAVGLMAVLGGLLIAQRHLSHLSDRERAIVGTWLCTYADTGGDVSNVTVLKLRADRRFAQTSCWVENDGSYVGGSRMEGEWRLAGDDLRLTSRATDSAVDLLHIVRVEKSGFVVGTYGEEYTFRPYRGQHDSIISMLEGETWWQRIVR